MFWVLVAAAAVRVIVGAVVGGIVGSQNAHKATPSSTTFPTMAANRQIAAGTMRGTSTTSNNIHVFYQDLNTTDILYRLVWDAKAGTEQRVSLSKTPVQDTSLAIATSNLTSNNGIEFNLFYSWGDERNASISVLSQATLECVLCAENCINTYNEVINTQEVEFDFGQSAVSLPSSTDTRVFFQAGGSARILVGNEPKTNGWSTNWIFKPSTTGSSIFASYVETLQTLEVVFVNDGIKILREVAYNGTLGLDSSNREKITVLALRANAVNSNAVC